MHQNLLGLPFLFLLSLGCGGQYILLYNQEPFPRSLGANHQILILIDRQEVGTILWTILHHQNCSLFLLFF
jgi:hypothetical protein